MTDDAITKPLFRLASIELLDASFGFTTPFARTQHWGNAERVSRCFVF
jgi:hypothetical protein